MSNFNYAKIKALENARKKQVLSLCPNATEYSGIYAFIREDDHGLRYAYIGQAKHLLTRLAQHLGGYDQHIDVSIRKRGLLSIENTQGWNIIVVCFCEPHQLDDRERFFIRQYANDGWQLYNKTIGGQDGGKSATMETVRKGYNDGLRQGREKALKEVAHILRTHCKPIEPQKQGNKTQEKAIAKLMAMLGEDEQP